MSRLYAANLAYTTLDLPISDSSASFTVDDPTNFPDNAPFIVKCESEIMLVGAIDKPTKTFSSVTRGYEGTTAAAHDDDTTISNIITAGYLNTMYENIEDKVDSTGGTINGDVTITPSSGSTSGDVDVTINGDVTIAPSSGSTSGEVDLGVTGTITMSTSTESTAAGQVINPKIKGGSFVDEFDANDQVLGKPVIKNYKETLVEVNATGSTSSIELDLLEGNIFKVTQTGSIAGIDVLNASTIGVNPLTLDILSDSSTYTLAWMAAYSVIAASTKVTASTADDSFNVSSTAFGDNVQAGDIITVSGFSTGSSGNNDSWRVVSASTSKIVVSDDLEGSTSGDAVTITRQQEFFVDTVVPDAPTAYEPKVFTMWSYGDTTRWRIAEVGEF